MQITIYYLRDEENHDQPSVTFFGLTAISHIPCEHASHYTGSNINVDIFNNSVNEKPHQTMYVYF